MVITLENMQGEVRGGFYIQPIMKRVWAVQLDMLKEIDKICRRHHIQYWGWYGTLLGAVRHQGYIPWDDDIDLAMLREDYERFLYYSENELPEGWQVLKTAPALICVKNTNVVRLDQGFLDQYHGCPYSVGLDIFCLDRIPCEGEERKMHMTLFCAVRSLHVNWSKEDENRWSYLRDIQEFTGYHIDEQKEIEEQLRDLGDKISAMYWDTEYDEVAFVPWLLDDPLAFVPLSCFDRRLEVSFENMRIPIMEEYDLVCRRLYGDDYMTPKRVYTHNYPFFRNQIEGVRDFFAKQGEPFPDFFDMTGDEKALNQH